jgi:hypothetical protein
MLPLGRVRFIKCDPTLVFDCRDRWDVSAVSILSRTGQTDRGYVIALIDAQHVSAMNFVPSYLALFLEHPN